jgi:hypothetical protein
MRSSLFRYRLSLGIFILGLIISGLTTFPLRSELALLTRIFGASSLSDSNHLSGFSHWISFVNSGLRETYSHFPFFGYATDWLGFGHLVIAAFFILPLIWPQQYRGVLFVGLAACGGVLVTAFVSGPFREIPIYWRLIDCSFGIVGAIPLVYCLCLDKQLENRA